MLPYLFNKTGCRKVQILRALEHLMCYNREMRPPNLNLNVAPVYITGW